MITATQRSKRSGPQPGEIWQEEDSRFADLPAKMVLEVSTDGQVRLQAMAVLPAEDRFLFQGKITFANLRRFHGRQGGYRKLASTAGAYQALMAIRRMTVLPAPSNQESDT